MPKLSHRSDNVPLSPFRKLAPLAEKAKASGKKVYHLNIGQPDIPTPAWAFEKLKQMDIKVLEYGTAEGLDSYRNSLLPYYKRYGIELRKENIIVTTGASEAISFIFLACLDEGDEIIVPEPFYANYNGFAHMAGVVIKPVTCYIENGFALPEISDFEKLITDRTKAIFITNPNNPTGCFYSETALRSIAELILQHDLFLFVDEVYREFCFDGQSFFSALCMESIRDRTVVFDSVSKRYSACGARVGAMISYNDELLERAGRYAKLRLSPPMLGQFLSQWMLQDDQAYLSEVKEEYDRRRKKIFQRLSQMQGVQCYLPGGAFYCFAKFPIHDAEHFCRWLLEEFSHNGATLMLSPGPGFYATPGLGLDEVRLAFVLNESDLDKAMDCLEIALLTYPGARSAIPGMKEPALFMNI